MSSTQLVGIAIPGIELSQGVQLNAVGLAITNPDLTIDELTEIARGVYRSKTATSWWLGDLSNIIEAIHGETYAEIMDVSGYSYSHLSNCAYVCRRIPCSRRRENLGFSMHAVVASLEPADQDRWLDEAEALGWSVADLRVAVRASKTAPEPTSAPQWSKDDPVSTEPMAPAQVADAEERAKKTLGRPLPAGHPLHETLAESHARDVVALASTVRTDAPADHNLVAAVRRLIWSAAPLDDSYKVPREALDEVAALVADED